MSLEIPTIHLNGTGVQRLMDALEEAYDKIRDAENALAQTAPNGRDYYVKPNGALERAQSQHCARIQKLLDIRAELEEVMDGISAQEWRRE